MLKIKNVSSGYGTVQILRRVSLTVDSGAIVALIGANGMGKTTLLHMINGLLKCWEGEVIFNGKEITNLQPREIVNQGISQVFQGRELFGPLTVLDNLLLGFYAKSGERRREEKQRLFNFVWSLFPRLEERKTQVAESLSGGEQQMLAIARALMQQPKVLFLDEPSEGISPLLVKNIFTTIKRLNEEEGLTILLVEQDIYESLSLAKYGYLLESGQIVLEGSAKWLLHAPEIERIILGKKK
jgi:branched-chain amino acid transport system ATP-binding protein